MAEERVLKVGVVCLGRGLHIVDSIIGESNMCLYAICDASEKRLEEGRKHFEEEKGVKDLHCFTSYEEFLASDVEAVVVASGVDRHVPMSIQALEAGKHVLSEIPVVNTIEEAKILKDAVRKHPNLKYFAGENCCFWRFVVEWKKLIENGYVGKPVLIEGEYLHHEAKENTTPPDYFYEPDGSIGWRVDLNAIQYLTHELGPILYMLGDDRVVSVCGFKPDFETVEYKQGRGASNELAVFKTAKGAIIKIFIGFGVDVGFDHNFIVYGSEGMIETDRRTMVIDAHSYGRFHHMEGINGGAKIELPWTTKFPGEKDDGHGGCDTQMMKAFAKCILEDTKPPVDVDMGIQMSIAGIYAHESAVKGGIPIEIPEF